MFKLVIQDDEGKTTVVPLIRDEITIGRKEGNTIRLTERNVSRRHARILRNNGEVHIEDLGSYNGIRVNNARIAERVSLRVSDQVQIGDYKLYLKAEGVEQVDDARTMPIERVDANTATDVIPAIANAAPTAPIAVPPIPSTPAPGQINLAGNANRTLVAVADTDPSGRPIASAAAVAALAPPVGNGKLVVLSSNFAGKEFELSRSQMIVGRTDENDLVINHRSISRNHAKLVREPDTGRYTISDLQSSNGVRVNGQDYGKVELRRGDVIDLGHVRLRFVEPGEDFVFSRDAVITDVPDVGSKKGLLVAILLGVVVLAAVVIFFLTRGPEKSDERVQTPGSQTNNDVADAGSGNVVAQNLVDAADLIKEPVDAGSASTPNTNSEADRLGVECLNYMNDKQWVALEDCGGKLAKLDAAKSKEFIDKGSMESKAEASLRQIDDALKVKDLQTARVLLAKITDKSVYRNEAETKFKKVEKSEIDGLVSDLKRMKSADCKTFQARLRNAEGSVGKQIADAARSQVSCKVEPPPPRGCTETSCGAGARCEDGKCIKVATVAKSCPEVPCGAGMQCDAGKCKAVAQQCDPVAIKDAEDRGDQNNAQGNFVAAIAAWDSQIKCKPAVFGKKSYMAACKAHKFPEAKRYFKGYIPAANQDYMSQICLKEGYDPRN